MSDWVTTLLCLVEMQFPGARIILFERPELTLHPCGRRCAHRSSLRASYGSCGCKRKCPLLIRLCESSALSFQLQQTMGICRTRVYSISRHLHWLEPDAINNWMWGCCCALILPWRHQHVLTALQLLRENRHRVCPHLFTCTSFANEKQNFVCLHMSKDFNALQMVWQVRERTSNLLGSTTYATAHRRRFSSIVRKCMKILTQHAYLLIS